MSVQTDKIGLRKAFQWLEDNKLRIEAVSFDDCTDNIVTLEPFRQRHHDLFSKFFTFYKDSWHKGKKLKTKSEKVFLNVWAKYEKDPIGETKRFQSMLQEVYPNRVFQVSETLQNQLELVEKLKAMSRAELMLLNLSSASNTSSPNPPTAEVEMKTLTHSIMLESPSKYPVWMLDNILRYLEMKIGGKKKDKMERIFQTRSTVIIPAKVMEKNEKKAEASGLETQLETAQKRLQTIMDAEKKVVLLELSDKGSLLSSHFHACSHRCNGGDAKLLRTYFLNCLRHWEGDHAMCESSHCKSEKQSSKVALNHILSLATLYLVFTSGKPGTNMTLDNLRYYVRDLATSICESFHSYLTFWAPKGIDFSSSYETRILMAELCWNENRDRVRVLLPRRKEPEKGKRARGGIRSRWKTPVHFKWANEIMENMDKI
jgi:hypothetical protein